MIKIGFSGLPDSGKSAICGEVRKILSLKQRVLLLEDISSSSPFDHEQKHSFDSYFYLMTSQINSEIIAKFKPFDFIITDMTLFDFYYRWLFFQKEQKDTSHLNEKRETLKTLYTFWKKSYDLVFFVKSSLEGKECLKEKGSAELYSYPILQQLEQHYHKNFEKEHLPIRELSNSGEIEECALSAAQTAIKLHENQTGGL
jgi:hypothetical protein